jgi:von Willebrand factor type A domain/FHA domain
LEDKEMQGRVGSAIRVVGLAAALVGASLAHAAEPPALVALVLDTSGSVGEADLARTRELALGILANLPPGSEVAVLTFDDQSRVVQPRTANPEEVRTALSQAKIAGRYTALYDALYDASRYLHDARAARKAIVLVTDGKDENSSLNLDDGLRVAEENGIPVYAVGVGHVEERILRRIAKLTGGDYFAGTEARGPDVAQRILATPVPAHEPLPQPAPAASAAAPLVSTPVPARPAAPSRRAISWLWAALAGGLALAAGLSWLALRRATPARCPRCSRVLASVFSECPFCAAEDALMSSSTETPLPESVLSETVVARLSSTEEFLEKTITLQEKPILLVTAGASVGQVFNLSLESVTSIGRAKANDIILEDVAISSQHCRVRPENGSFVVHDLRSTNGTFLNERRITRSPLASGDILKVGETSLQFRMDQKRDGFGRS